MNMKPLLAIFAAATICCGSLATAQQVTRIVVPFNAGGATDVYVRMIASELSKAGTQTIVENKPGASGIIGAEYVVKSKPDGTTLFTGSNSTLANNAVLFDKLPYDPFRDFTSVTNIAYYPSILIARADLPYKTLTEMVAYAKANPGKINRASVGAGNITNLAGVLFDKTAGISTTHVPYTGDTAAIQGLLSGTVDVYVGAITLTLPNVQSGKLRVLGVFDNKRLAQLPDVPTFKEAGYNVEAYVWYCLVAPAGTPAATVERLNRDVNRILNQDSFVARARALGIEVRGGSPADLTRFIKSEYDRWAPLIRELGLKGTS